MISKQKTNRRVILSAAYNDYNKGLNSHAFFRVSNQGTADDLVQETFLKTWGYLLKGGKIDIMRAFLYRVLNNLIVDEYRKRKNKMTSLDELLDKGFDPGNEDSDRLINILDGKAAALLIQRLPEIYRKVMRLRYMQGLSIKEISLITGKSKNSCSVRIHRGREKLQLLYNRT